MGRTLTRDEVEAAVAATHPVTRLATSAFVLAHMSGGLAAGLVTGSVALDALTRTFEPDPHVGAARLVLFVCGALAGALIDGALRTDGQPRTIAIAAWLATAVGAVTAVGIGGLVGGVGSLVTGAGLVLGVSMHTRLSLDSVVATKRALIRWAQWVAMVLGLVAAYSVGTTVLLVDESRAGFDAARILFGIAAACGASVAAAGLAAMAPSPRVLLLRGAIEEGVRALVRSGRARRAECADEAVGILIGASLRELGRRRTLDAPARTALRYGYALALLVGCAGTAAWAAVGPIVLLRAGASTLQAAMFALAAFALGGVSLILYSAPGSRLARALEADPEGTCRYAAAVNGCVLAVVAVSVALAPAGVVVALVALASIVSILASVGVLIPAGVAAIRRWVPSFKLRRARGILYGAHMAAVAAAAVATVGGPVALVLGCGALAQLAALGIVAVAGARLPRPNVVVPETSLR